MSDSASGDAMLAEIRVFSSGSAPPGWRECTGQLLDIDTNQALFSLLHWRYGGDGSTTFALPAAPRRHGQLVCCIAMDGRYPLRDSDD